MSGKIDLTGKRFGNLVVMYDTGERKRKSICWMCQCDCGNFKIVRSIELIKGDTKSCGCLHSKVVSERMRTHGKSKTRLYRVWAGIKNRCYNQSASNYIYYGGKGITMYDKWRDDYASFEEWAYQNGFDDSLTSQECSIDRIDTSKGYTPDNCRWVSHTAQCNNQTSNKMLTFNGETMSMAEWARKIGIKYTTLRARIRRGMPLEEALTK